MSADHSNDVFHHIRDALHFEIPKFLDETGATAQLPKIMGFQVTKFMILEVIAGLLTLFIFWGLARHIRKGSPARGRFWNFWEAIALFIRDNVVRDAIGEGHHDHEGHHGHGDHGHGDHGHAHGDHGHDDHAHAPAAAKLNPADYGVVRVGHPADKFAPFVLTIFFFILFCNLLGAVPWLGSPTGHLAVTGVLALAVFVRVVLAGSAELGVTGFWKALAPKMDLPPLMAMLIIPMIWGIEVIGLLIKHGVLSVRLFANIMGGHTVVAVLLGFIATVAQLEYTYPQQAWLFGPLYWVVAPASVGGQVFVGLIELFVAFLQAYIFAYLTSIFIGTAVHPH